VREKSLFHIHPSGGLLTTQFIDKLRNRDTNEPHVKSDTFGFADNPAPTPAELEKKISEAWYSLLDKWHGVSVFLDKYDLSKARDRWIIPLLLALDFKPVYLKGDTLLPDTADVKIPLSHRGGDWKHAPIIHTVEPSQELDERPSKKRGIKSPHDDVQIYLNETKKDTWAIVTNGRLLRILRDYHHTYTKGYVEFDLEGIFEERSFSDFMALYRLVHPSRFVPDKDGVPPLEHFYKKSLAAGEKIGDDLRANVKLAIERLGNGFLTKSLIDEMIDDPEKCQEYYQEILHVVYRIIFLMFAEQRGMLPSRDSLYADAYSITKLRERAEKAKRRDTHKDVWKGLLVTFDMIKKGVEDPKIKIFGYNGGLFDDGMIKLIKDRDCENTAILDAVRYLTTFESEKTLQRISYVDLGVEEIGSIYESLLDFTPRILNEDVAVDGITYVARHFFLDPRGSARKTTASYYTDPRLVNELIKSALKPVLEDRLRGKKTAEDKEKALLAINVCDPACGSAAFLIAATNYLGKELAKIRTDTEYPPDNDERKARRDVLQHCIYGVDLNPMAVELAKVSLWINACMREMPLSYLDYHIKCGNSLIGATPELVRKGVPDEAFDAVEGDDKAIAKEVKKINKQQAKNRTLDQWHGTPEGSVNVKFNVLKDLPEGTINDINTKKAEYEKLLQSEEHKLEKLICNTWVAAFFWPLAADSPSPPTTGVLSNMFLQGKSAISPDQLQMVKDLNEKYRFFHWHLEFPEVFSGKIPGFDCVCGNPPWEMDEFDPIEFCMKFAPQLAMVSPAGKRDKMIMELAEKNRGIMKRLSESKEEPAKKRKMYQNKNVYPLSSYGRINIAFTFAERNLFLINNSGRLGIVIPTGLITDDFNKYFFQSLMVNNQLISSYDFENKYHLFESVDSRQHFSLLTLSGGNLNTVPDIAFYLLSVDDIELEELHWSITQSDIAKINPNTLTCPIFHNKEEAKLVREVYSRIPTLIVDSKNYNPWLASINLMFIMNTDSKKGFVKRIDELEFLGIDFNQNYNEILINGKTYLPLIEAKSTALYDHRFAQAYINPENPFRQVQTREIEPSIKSDPSYKTTPVFYASKDEFDNRIPNYWKYNWFSGFKRVTSATNERTLVGTILPRIPISYTFYVVFSEIEDIRLLLCLYGNLWSFCGDYFARLKTTQPSLPKGCVEECPLLPPDAYSKELIKVISDNIFELVYTGNDLRGFAQDIGYVEKDGALKAPFKWDETRRFELKCELDAIYFILYGISIHELEYIMDAFPIVKSNDISNYGEYRTLNKIKQYYEKYKASIISYKHNEVSQ